MQKTNKIIHQIGIGSLLARLHRKLGNNNQILEFKSPDTVPASYGKGTEYTKFFCALRGLVVS